MRRVVPFSILVVISALGVLAGVARADFLRPIDPADFPGPAVRAFGNQQVGTSATSTVKIASCNNTRPVPDTGACDTGGGQSSFVSFVFGPGCAEFSYVAPPALPVDITNGTASAVIFTFRYTPTNRGADTCVVTADATGADDTDVTFTLTGTGIAPELVIDPAPVQFGGTPVGSPVNTNVTLRNPGENSLTITSLAFNGANAGDFAFTNQGCDGDNPCNVASGLQTSSIMANGGSAVFGLRCTPSTSGPRNATLVVTTNDPVSPVRSAGLTCTGTVPELSVSTSSHGFGAQRVGTTSAVFTFTIANGAGAAPLAYTVSGATAPRFTLTCPALDPNCLQRTLLGGESTTFDVAFAPVAAGMVNQSITIDTNDPTPADDPFLIGVTGTGVESVVSAAALDLGSVAVGGSSTQDLTVSNVGTATLTIAGNAPAALEISGGAGQFAIVLPAGAPACAGVQTCTRTIGPIAAQGGSTAIPIRCTPTAAGLQQATLIIRSDATTSPTSVALRCTGIIPDVVVSSLMLSFPDQRVGTPSAARTFTVGNAAGAAPLAYTVSEASPDFALSCTAPGCNGTLAAGASITVSVTFTPASAGVKMANVTVATPGDPDEMSTLVMVGGTGVEPLVTVDAPSPAPLAIGDVDVGAGGGGTVTLRNSGTADLSISAVTLVGGDAAQFSITAGGVGAQTLSATAGMNTRSWTVTCTPTTIGNKSTTFRVVHDAPAVGTQTNIAVTCTGRGAVFTPSVVAPAVIDFGQVQVGMPSIARTFTFTNTGNKPGRIAMLTSTVNVFAPSTMANLANDIAPTGSITVSVVFTPADSSVVNAQVCGVHNGLGSPSCVGVTGDGASVGIDLLPAVDFGAVRFDAGPQTSADVTMINTGESVLRVDSITSAGAPFTIVNGPNLPVNLALNEARTFKVRLTPGMALGTVTRQISVNGVFTVSGTAASASIQATARIVAPQVAMTADTIDFGAFDLDDPGTPVTRSITITNTGDAATGADLHVGAPVLASGAPEFSIVDGAPAIVPPGGSAMLTVAFDATTAGLKTGQVTLVIDALGGMSYTVALRAVAVDQNVMCAPGTIMFPATVRGQASASIDATVTNLDFATGAGTAAVVTYSAAISGPHAADYSLPTADAGGMIAGNTSKALPITFRPRAAGDDRGATLTVSWDDGGARSCTVALTGDGRLRALTAAPGAIDFGTVALGSPVLLSAVASPLVLTSNEPAGASATTVTKLELTGAGASSFRVIGGDAARPLPMGGSLTYDLEFDPAAEGTFAATVEVYLDDDPDPQYTIDVTGRAVEPATRGNPYTCSAGGSSTGALALGLALAFALRRRRRAAA